MISCTTKIFASDFHQNSLLRLLKNHLFMKTILTVIFMTACALEASSQKLNETKVPQIVKTAFQKAHPAVKANWEWEDENYEANFKENGKEMSCVINKQGSILETESPIAVTELPAGAKAYLDEHYKGKKWKETTKIVKANGEVNYEVDIAGKDVLFDTNGHHLQPKKEVEKD
jgi:hypothetical protein